MKILALDYEGVIADSQIECLVVGFNAYLRFNKKTKLFGGEKFTFDNFRDKIKKNKKILDRYIKLRAYFIDAFSWYVVMHILENNIKIKDQNEFDKSRKKLIHLYKKYEKNFYNVRFSLQKEYDKWLKLINAFDVVNSIRKLEKKFILTIATNNRKQGIIRMLQKHKIHVKTITDNKIGVNKVKHLELIRKKYKAKFSDIHFVDDQVSHFPNLVKLGVNCYLATWGYNNAEQRKKARKIGVELLNEGNFYRELSQ